MLSGSTGNSPKQKWGEWAFYCISPIPPKGLYNIEPRKPDHISPLPTGFTLALRGLMISSNKRCVLMAALLISLQTEMIKPYDFI